MKTTDAFLIGIELGKFRKTIDEWEESKHKRAPNGQFSSTGGSAGNKLEEEGPSRKMSPLEAFKENARQFNEALQEGKKRGAHIVEFKGITGQTVKRYWTGARYEDRPSSLYEKSNTKYKMGGGTYKAEFRMPE